MTTTRSAIDQAYLMPEAEAIARLVTAADLGPGERNAITGQAAALVRRIRSGSKPGMMEVFLAEYGLSTDEGIALMCLAEALLRVPDAATIDALIEDKIAPSDWGRHLGHSASSLVNASTWALMLTGRVLDDARPGMGGVLRGALKRVGEPVIRTAVAAAMKEMGRQFVLGESIEAAMTRAEKREARGFTYSYDMLGEAARTEEDAARYFAAYHAAIIAIGTRAKGTVQENPGISVKLSALHPRYEEAQADRVMAELAPRLLALCKAAAGVNIGLNIDAEEADRLVLSLDLIEAILPDPALKGWEGFGVVVQAYGQRAPFVIDHLYGLATAHDRRIMIRLVKGAYWDAEIKRAQVEGLEGFPVFTSKQATDVSYIANARRLLSRTDRIYPQFATHNAHTVATVLHMADTGHIPATAFEFQRLHGMGEVLHDLVLTDRGTRCRIYAPVGAHRDLLAYLVRRLLENGANSSFVNRIVDESIPPESVVACPFDQLGQSRGITAAPDLFGDRRNSAGCDMTHRPTRDRVESARAAFATTTFTAGPVIAGHTSAAPQRPVVNPADLSDTVGHVTEADAADIEAAFTAARPWDAPAETRAALLNAAADAYEANAPLLYALLAREAGKTLPDAIGEVREAVDFLRYYAAGAAAVGGTPRGLWTCVSPWNFPLAIFTGQIAAALATGNAVLAKPAPQTPLIAYEAVRLIHAAGIPASALALLPGGASVGAALTGDARVNGVAFTGSTATARRIRQAMAGNCAPGTPLIAETGGINAMIVDSTALPEHAVRDIVNSAFRSAGQRCSALRCLYLQDDIAPHVIAMIKGAMEGLVMGNPWDYATDIGPLIDDAARAAIAAHLTKADVIHAVPAPTGGHFLPPTMVRVKGIEAIGQEIFGPVLHVATFKASQLDKVIDTINAQGYGLTFGLHTRIDDRVQTIVDRIAAGNIYVNRNQIGAVVGSQPFGGEGLSGTGPKAGGPYYMARFVHAPAPQKPAAERTMAGPTGESNRLTLHPRGAILCLGPDQATQVAQVQSLGGAAVKGTAADLTRPDIAAVLWNGDAETARGFEQTLATRSGPLVPLVTGAPDVAHVMHERHICIDTTAAGGNAALLAEAAH